MVAGVVMAMWAMIISAVTGMGFLMLPQVIAAPLLGPPRMGAFNAAAFV